MAKTKTYEQIHQKHHSILTQEQSFHLHLGSDIGGLGIHQFQEYAD